MKTTIIRRRLGIGLFLFGFHLLISVPFLFLGPMLTIPSDSGPLAWVWIVLEFPALMVIGATGLQSRLPGSHSPSVEYAWFVAVASIVWFMYGIALQIVIQAVRGRRGRHGKVSDG
jgi:quinol-cytochrome oxidoreductase complex cytochrome b subunit